jgi:hypothetical protein
MKSNQQLHVSNESVREKDWRSRKRGTQVREPIRAISLSDVRIASPALSTQNTPCHRVKRGWWIYASIMCAGAQRLALCASHSGEIALSG